MGSFNFFDKIVIPSYDDPNQLTAGTVSIDKEKCSGCPICIEVCPADSLFLVNEKATLKPFGENGCIACGDCVAICPEDAIRLMNSYHFTKYFKTIDQGPLSGPRLFQKNDGLNENPPTEKTQESQGV